MLAVDALYNKPLQTNFLMLGPKKTIDVLLIVDWGIGRYYMVGRAYSSRKGVVFDNTPILHHFADHINVIARAIST